jgi:hypothetical protein
MIKKSFVFSLMIVLVFGFSVFYFGGSAARAETSNDDFYLDDSFDYANAPACTVVSAVCGMVGGSTSITDIPFFGVPGVTTASILKCSNPHTNSPDFDTYMNYMRMWGARGSGGNNYIACQK